VNVSTTAAAFVLVVACATQPEDGGSEGTGGSVGIAGSGANLPTGGAAPFGTGGRSMLGGSTSSNGGAGIGGGNAGANAIAGSSGRAGSGGLDVGGANTGGAESPDASSASGGTASDGGSVACKTGPGAVFDGTYQPSVVNTAEPLRGFTEVTGDVWFEASPSGIANIACLRKIGGNFIIDAASDGTVADLRGLEGLKAIGGSLTVYTGVTASGRPPILSLSGLSGLETVGGSVTVNDLPSLHGLEALKSIGGSLVLSNNYELADFRALESLTTLSGITVSGPFDRPARLKDFRGLERVANLESVDIFHSDSIESFAGLPAVTKLARLRLEDTPKIASVGFFSNVTELGDVFIANTGITSLSALSKVTRIGGDVSIFDNAALVSLAGLENVTAIDGGLVLQGSASTTFDELRSVRRIGGSLDVLSPMISSLSGLASLTGFGALTTVGGAFRIVDDDLVPNLDAFTALASIGGDLHLYENQKLPTCKASSFAAKYAKTCSCPRGSTPPCTGCTGAQYCLCTGLCGCSGNDKTQIVCL
jgi:hypothetical protein